MVIERAMKLNPHHPGWYRTICGFDEYRQENYGLAIDELVKANLPDLFWTYFGLAAAYAQLGEQGAAQAAVEDLLARVPDFAQSGEGLLRRWFDPRMAEHLMQGLRKAGLPIGE